MNMHWNLIWNWLNLIISQHHHHPEPVIESEQTIFFHCQRKNQRPCQKLFLGFWNKNSSEAWKQNHDNKTSSGIKC